MALDLMAAFTELRHPLIMFCLIWLLALLVLLCRLVGLVNPCWPFNWLHRLQAGLIYLK